MRRGRRIEGEPSLSLQRQYILGGMFQLQKEQILQWLFQFQRGHIKVGMVCVERR
jgi:hypothetical protein